MGPGLVAIMKRWLGAFNCNHYKFWMAFPSPGPLTLGTMYITWLSFCSPSRVAYADYESGGYSPKLLKPSDIEEVLYHSCFANFTGPWVCLGRSWLVFTRHGFPGADLWCWGGLNEEGSRPGKSYGWRQGMLHLLWKKIQLWPWWYTVHDDVNQ